MSETTLPSAWSLCTFADIGKIVGGGTPSTANPDYWGDEVRWISPSDLTGYKSKFIARGAKSLSELGLDNCSAKLMPAGSVHFSSRAPIGYVVISSESLCTNQGFKSLIPAEGVFNEYVYFYLKSIKGLANSLATGTTFKELSGSAFAKLPFPLPPLPEQKRIVAKIEELFSELEAGEESLRVARRQLGAYRQSLLKQAFEGKLTAKWRTKNRAKLEPSATLLARIQSERQSRYEQQLKNWDASVRVWASAGQKGKRPTKPTEPAIFATKAFDGVEVPEGWAVEQIGNCPTDALIGLVRSADEQDTGPAGFSYIKMDRVDMLGNTDLRTDVFVNCAPDEVDRFALRKGDLLFNTRNSVELVGKVGIVRRDPETPTVYNNNLMRLRLPDCLDPLFVGLQLCAQPFRQRMEKVKKATTSVAAVYGKDFWPLPLVLCSLPEQQEIVRLLDEQFEGIGRNEREIDGALRSSAALRQAILQKAFTGRLVPQHPSDEPAAALLARLRAERSRPKP